MIPALNLRRVLAFSLVISMIGVFSGCSNKDKETQSTVTLYWWRSKFDAPIEVLEKTASNYMQKNKNVKIEVVIPENEDYEAYKREAKDALASWKTIKNAPDILSIKGQDLSDFATSLSPAPSALFDTQAEKKLNKSSIAYVREMFYPVVGQSSILVNPKDKKEYLFGLPMALDTMALYVNKDLFNRAIENIKNTNTADGAQKTEKEVLLKRFKKPPLTWKDLIDFIPLSTVKAGEDVTLATIALGESTNIEHSYDILSNIMLQNGTSMVSDDYSSAIFNQAEGYYSPTGSNGVKALNFYMQFSNPASKTYTWNKSLANDYDLFGQGKLMMLPHFASTYTLLVNDYKDMKSQIQASSFPQIVDPTVENNADKVKTTAQMWLETAPSTKGDATKQKEAWKFIHYITTQDHSYMASMQMPSALVGQSGKSRFAAFNEASQYAETWYKGDDSSTVDLIFARMIAESSTDRNASQSALDKATADVTKILKASIFKYSTPPDSSKPIIQAPSAEATNGN